MLNVKVTGVREAQADLREIQAVLSDSDYMWDAIIDRLLIEEIKDVFESEADGKWPPRLDNKPHPLLRKSLALYKSLTVRGAPGHVDIRTQDTLEYGTDISYAIFHEEGTARIPARPFLETVVQRGNFEQRLEELIERILEDRIEKVS